MDGIPRHKLKEDIEEINMKLTLDTEKQVFFYEQDFYVLSNFSSFTLQWNGFRFDTSEAAYHWEKFAKVAPDAAVKVKAATSAHNAFKLAEELKYLRPDAKSQVTIEYDDNNNPIRIDTIVVSTQHDDFDTDKKMLDKIREDVINIVVPRVKISENPRATDPISKFGTWFTVGIDQAKKYGDKITPAYIKMERPLILDPADILDYDDDTGTIKWLIDEDEMKEIVKRKI